MSPARPRRNDACPPNSKRQRNRLAISTRQILSPDGHDPVPEEQNSAREQLQMHRAIQLRRCQDKTDVARVCRCTSEAIKNSEARNANLLIATTA